MLLFAHDVVLMVPSACDLQHSLDQLSAECETAGMRISTPKSEVKALRKLTGCPLSFLRALSTCEGTLEPEIGQRIGTTAMVLQSL